MILPKPRVKPKKIKVSVFVDPLTLRMLKFHAEQNAMPMVSFMERGARLLASGKVSFAGWNATFEGRVVELKSPKEVRDDIIELSNQREAEKAEAEMAGYREEQEKEHARILKEGPNLTYGVYGQQVVIANIGSIEWSTRENNPEAINNDVEYYALIWEVNKASVARAFAKFPLYGGHPMRETFLKYLNAAYADPLHPVELRRPEQEF